MYNPVGFHTDAGKAWGNNGWEGQFSWFKSTLELVLGPMLDRGTVPEDKKISEEIHPNPMHAKPQPSILQTIVATMATARTQP